MRELVIDSFAGGGGASLGIEQALGRPVDVIGQRELWRGYETAGVAAGGAP